METFESLVRAEFTPKNTYLNTASNALLPARTVAALRDAVRLRAEGRSVDPLFADVEACRAAYARLVGVPVERVATGATVALHTALIAASLQPGAEVLTVEENFTSVLNPFHTRGDLKVRAVPLHGSPTPSGRAPRWSRSARPSPPTAGSPTCPLCARRPGRTGRAPRDVPRRAGCLPISLKERTITVLRCLLDGGVCQVSGRSARWFRRSRGRRGRVWSAPRPARPG
ncbi:hypothetical protein SGRIM128S_09338 [Streptomyces griseomycini]